VLRIEHSPHFPIKLAGGPSWHVAFHRNWDNQPLAYCSSRDHGTSSGLDYTSGIK